MTLTDLLQNEDLRRHEFPVVTRAVYLAHAGVCPLPRRVAEAVAAAARDGAMGDQETAVPRDFIPQTRALAARLLGATPEEIALVGPTSLALSLVANGLSFRRRANVLVYFDDYPSNVYPWMSLAERGVEVRFLNLHRLGVIRPVDVLGQVDEDTALVALASCHFIAGWRPDLARIGTALRERGILFCVDGIQTLGAFPTLAAHADIIAADAHKWLLGPCAAGILYVRREVQEQLQPSVFGWHNLRCPNFVAQEELKFRPDARRYEAGSANLLGLAGLKAALELALELGVDAIAAELLRKRTRLVAALREKGYEVLCADTPPENAGGIVSFHRPGTDMGGLHARLAAEGIITSLRADRAGTRYLRFSPHYYNTDAELDRALARL